MVDEQTKQDLFNELESLENELKGLSKSEKTPVHPFLYSALHFFTGMLFLLLFFITVGSESVAGQLVSVASFIIATLALLRVLADITREKTTGFLSFLFVGLLLVLSVSYYLLWTQVLSAVSWIVFLVLFIVFCLEVVFYALHAYMAYMNRSSSYESGATAVIMFISFVIVLAAFLYHYMIIYLLFFIAVSVFAKANSDFVKTLRKK